ncbi:MAG: 4-(cytidine 5'-diphospho)-2-C-methyl-D-erythritol kinase [Chloroflexi bacterium]|nr:4-(cytidine 5'-diphospho)-2-C-methyl-D-erythritol kinase [Chloroflexota bacterium]
MGDSPIRVTAFAKVNLTLEVLGRRPDGYHEVASILQTIDLADEILAEPADELTFVCSDPALAGPENLVIRAATLLRAHASVRAGARLTLRKRIPTAAGLGGGSSDAAATLRALLRLWNLPYEPSDPAVRDLAARLGSDVPFFLLGGTALARGRGEQLSVLPPVRGLWLVLVFVDGALSAGVTADKTRRVYAALRPTDFADGGHTGRVVDRLRTGDPFAPGEIVNSFTAVAGRVFPSLDEQRQWLASALGREVHVAGSGPTLLTAFSSEAEAASAAGQVCRLGRAVRFHRSPVCCVVAAPAPAAERRTCPAPDRV